MGSITVGTLNDGAGGYTCTISYDNPTRSGDKVKIKNVKATITHASGNQTRNRIAVSVSINGTSKAYNVELKRMNRYDEYWPTSAEVTIVDSTGFEFNCLSTSFPISATFRSTGYNTSWDQNEASVSTASNQTIGCPARTYSVTFNANGGSGAPSAQSKTYGSALTLSSTVPTYSGYDFKGWSGSNGTTYQPGASYTSNADLTLTAIWQAQTTDLEDIDDIELGEAPEISWTPPSSSLTYKIKLSLGEWSWESDTISPGSTSEYTYNSYTIPLTVGEQLPDQTEGLMKCVLTTYSSGTATGTSEKYFTVTVPDAVVPTISSASFSDGSENALNVFLQNYSWVKAQATIAGAYGSTIVSAVLIVGDESKTVVPDSSSLTINSDVIEDDGTVTVSLTITDTRGRTATSSQSVTVYEYEPPSVSLSVSVSGKTLWINAIPTFSDVSGLNSATITIDDGPAQTVIPYTGYAVSHNPFDGDENNYTATSTVTDLVTSITATETLYPGKGNRFSSLDEDQYYLGMDDEGWKTLSDCDGGITEDGTIWFKLTDGATFSGVGLPAAMDADSDYELLYALTNSNENACVVTSFFEKESYTHSGYTEHHFRFIESTENLRSGAVFHTPSISDDTTFRKYELWGIQIFGATPTEGETVSKEYKNIVLRKISQSDELLTWEIETGVMGLDTPNQKYISRIQARIDYSGSLKVEIAYDNENDYKTVHESTSDHMKSITVPVNVKRADHFRIRMSGEGIVKLYSFGYLTEDGSMRCLI